MTWDDRNNATDEEAIKLISGRVIELAADYKNSWCENDDREEFRKSLKDVEEFAKKRGIPFSLDVIAAITLGVVSDDQDWQSSNLSC